MADYVPFLGLEDLREILTAVLHRKATTVRECRPLKVTNYLQVRSTTNGDWAWSFFVQFTVFVLTKSKQISYLDLQICGIALTGRSSATRPSAACEFIQRGCGGDAAEDGRAARWAQPHLHPRATVLPTPVWRALFRPGGWSSAEVIGAVRTLTFRMCSQCFAKWTMGQTRPSDTVLFFCIRIISVPLLEV